MDLTCGTNDRCTRHLLFDRHCRCCCATHAHTHTHTDCRYADERKNKLDLEAQVSGLCRNMYFIQVEMHRFVRCKKGYERLAYRMSDKYRIISIILLSRTRRLDDSNFTFEHLNLFVGFIWGILCWAGSILIYARNKLCIGKCADGKRATTTKRRNRSIPFLSFSSSNWN